MPEDTSPTATPPTTDTVAAISDWFFRGWLAAMSEADPTTADPRIDTVRRLLPGEDALSDTPVNMAKIKLALERVPLDKLQAERDRRNALHVRAVEAYQDPANRQTGTRTDVTTTDIMSGIGAGIWAFLKPLLPYAAVAAGIYLVATNLPKKGSADWRGNA